jgi:predicted nucleotidyltransferase
MYQKTTLDEIIKKLRDYFEKRDDIPMSFLFGSWAKNQNGVDSDIDDFVD